ncbi:MFS transporter [Microcoleus sp. FACHB-68]|uniref:MFS transporter n=1 Tax=Microcoleus sp. FACHB-68 TaxID=2692826 RepID=UPI0016833C1C|nr:MFS transporter [Microcoleus sp. FACHB-68]MBD1937636.1 MFS transporter [Microcoleus sp. FACHB-68]
MLPVTPPPSGSGFRTLFQNRPFMALWSGQIVSQVADKVFFVLLIALLVEYQPLPELRNSMRSALMVAVTLPAVFFGSAAGIFVDRFNKKQILVVTNAMRGLLTLALPLLPKQFIFLLAIGFLESILTQFFAPAEQATIPLLVPKQGLMSANALFTTTMLGSMIVGFAVGEPLLSLSQRWGGNYGQEFSVTVLYLIAAALFYLIPLKDNTRDDAIVAVHPWSDFKEGLRYLRKNRLVSNAMLQLTILYSVFAALMILAINLAQDIGLKPTQFGFLLAAAGVGMVFGAAVLGHWGERFHQKPLPLIGFLIMGFVLGVFTLVHELWLGLTLSGLLGLGASLIGVPMQTLIQQQTPESMRGKVFGFQNNVVNIALSVPLAIAGPLTDMVGLRGVMLAMSFVVCIVGIWAWQNTRRVLQDVI